jgi:hypothetical protein
MRKTLALLVAVLFVSRAFAGDASILGRGYLSLMTVPVYYWYTGEFDENGDYNKLEDGELSTNYASLGLAASYSPLDWIGLSALWVPGVTLASKVDVDLGTSEANIAGISNLSLGAAFQLVGPKAPINSERFRFTIAPGIKIPIKNVDFEDQYENFLSGDDVTVVNLDKRLIGYTAKVSLDYVISAKWFVDLTAKGTVYPGKLGYKDFSFANYGMYQYKKAFGIDENPDMTYGSEFAAEIDPHFSTFLGLSAILSANCPLSFEYVGDTTVDGESQDDANWLLSAIPGVSVVFIKTPVPLVAALNYGQPLAGHKVAASHTLFAYLGVVLKL